MKKTFTILMLLMAILVGSLDLEAKTTKKRAASSPAVKFKTLYDGYPDVGGHTYTTNIQGYKMTVQFGPYSSSNGFVEITVSYKGQWEKEQNNWYYEGDGIVMFYMDGGVPCYFEIRNGGKELYNEEGNVTLRLVK